MILQKIASQRPHLNVHINSFILVYTLFETLCFKVKRLKTRVSAQGCVYGLERQYTGFIPLAYSQLKSLI